MNRIIIEICRGKWDAMGCSPLKVNLNIIESDQDL